jgi:circadian clock protein KaiB
MTDDGRFDTTEAFEHLVEAAGRENYLLRLYVSGVTPRSSEALARIRAVCEEYLSGRYELEVIDIRQQPELAKEQQIIVTPTLIKVLPPPLRRLVGDLLETEQVLRGLNIRRRDEGT